MNIYVVNADLLVYILPNKLCYPEMVGSDYPLLYDNKDDFLKKIK